MRSGSDRVMKLHEKVEKLRESEEIGVRFMNAWEEKLLDRQDGYEEGLAVGEKRGRIAGRKGVCPALPKAESQVLPRAGN